MPRKSDAYRVKIEAQSVQDATRIITLTIHAPDDEFTFVDLFAQRKAVPPLTDFVKDGLVRYLETGETVLAAVETIVKQKTAPLGNTSGMDTHLPSGSPKRGRPAKLPGEFSLEKLNLE